MNNNTKLIAAALALSAVPAAAQIAAVRVAPALNAAPAAMSAVLSAAALPSASALTAAPSMAISAAPLSAPALAVAPAASLPAAHGALQAGAARLDAAAKSPAGRDNSRGLSAALFDGSALRAAADGPAPVDPSAQQVSALNAAVADILRPYNNQLSRASLTFSRIATNATRATEVSVSLDYAKKGPGGDASLKVENLSYSYPDAATAKPETRAKGSIGLNLLNLMTQEQINQMGPQAHKMVEEFIAEKTRQYGPAATVAASVTRQTVDAKGNLTALGLALDLDIDLAKLPAGTDPKTVLVTGLHATVDIALTGLDFSVSVVSNPNASQFGRDQVGMKETLDKLLARDPKTVASLGDLFRTLDQAADYATRGPRRGVAAVNPAVFPSELGYPEPSAHLAAALAAAGAADARLISAGAHLQNPGQIWRYTFYSASAQELITVGVDYQGRATLAARTPARGIAVSAPIDVSRVVPLARAYDAARRAGFYPETVSLERDADGRAVYRFEGLGDQQVLVDAETGSSLSPVR